MFCLNDVNTLGKTYELAGPEVYTQDQIAEMVYRHSDYDLFLTNYDQYIPK